MQKLAGGVLPYSCGVDNHQAVLQDILILPELKAMSYVNHLVALSSASYIFGLIFIFSPNMCLKISGSSLTYKTTF